MLFGLHDQCRRFDLLKLRTLKGTNPLGPVIGVIVSMLCLIWLITSIRSPVPESRHDFWVRSQIAIWILMAYQNRVQGSASLTKSGDYTTKSPRQGLRESNRNLP